jgi:hypothetical protein
MRCAVVGASDMDDLDVIEFFAVLGVARDHGLEVELIVPSDAAHTAGVPGAPWTVRRPAAEADLDDLAWWLQAAESFFDVWIIMGRSHSWAAVALRALSSRVPVILDLRAHDLSLLELPALQDDLAQVRAITTRSTDVDLVQSIVPSHIPVVGLELPIIDPAQTARRPEVIVLGRDVSQLEDAYGPVLSRLGFTAAVVEGSNAVAWRALLAEEFLASVCGATAVLVGPDFVDDGSITTALARGTPLLVDVRHSLAVGFQEQSCGFLIARPADLTMALHLLSMETIGARMRRSAFLAVSTGTLTRGASGLIGAVAGVMQPRPSAVEPGLDECRSAMLLVPVGSSHDLASLQATASRFDSDDDVTIVVCADVSELGEQIVAEVESCVLAGRPVEVAPDGLLIIESVTPERAAALVLRADAVSSRDPRWVALAGLANKSGPDGLEGHAANRPLRALSGI